MSVNLQYKYFTERAISFLFNKCIFNHTCQRLFSNTNIREQMHEEESRNAGKAKENFDIVISGGGLVGFAAACALGMSNRLSDKRILLLERQPKKNWIIGEEYSNRVFALNSNARELFTKIGAWNHIEKLRLCPVKKMQVWDSCSEASIAFDMLDNEDNIAHIVENEVILSSLEKSVPENVEVMYGCKISNYKLPTSAEDEVEINFENGETILSNLLIGADGANSLVRKSMGSHYLSWEYDQMGIIATLVLSEVSDNNGAWQKFCSTGPIALLPLSPNRSSLVWSTTKKNAKALLSLPDDEFADALNNAIWNNEAVHPLVEDVHGRWQNLLRTWLPSGGSVGTKQFPPSVSGVVRNSRAAFPLGLGHSSHYVAPRVALVGDAAHRVHPLAGQGVNLGFGDVTKLTNVLEDSVLQGCDIGDVKHLYKYETDRQRYNIATMAAIDALYRLHSTKFLPFVLMRSLGVSAVDSFLPLKKRIMQHAKGC